MATIIIPTPLRKFTGNATKVSVEGNTIREVLEALTTRYPELKKHLFDTEQNIRPFINIFIGEEDIRNLNQQNTTVAPGAVVSIIPAIAGGQ